MIDILKKCWVLLIAIAIYIAYGYYNNNFYLELISSRVDVARQNSNELHVAAFHGSQIPTGFMTGAEIALEEVNRAEGMSLVLHQVAAVSDSNGMSRLNRLLRRNLRITHVVAEAPPHMANQIAVLCESYGVGLFLLKLDPPFLTSEGFEYVVKLEPNFSAYCQAVIDGLGVVSGVPENQEISVGLFFDRHEPGDETLVNAFIGAIGSHNELYSGASAIQTAVRDGLLDKDQPLHSLDDTFYLQSGLSVAGTNLATYLNHKNHNKLKDITIEEALERTPALMNRVKYGFVHGFEPGKFSASRVGAATKSSELDAVIVLASVSESIGLIDELRDLSVKGPIICVDYQPSGWVESNLGDLAENVYFVSVLDPSRESPTLDDFEDKFRRRAQQSERVVREADQASVLAYEAVTILAALAREQDTKIPLETMTILQMVGAKWAGLSADKIGFNSVGDGIGRTPILITLIDGKYVSAKRKEL